MIHVQIWHGAGNARVTDMTNAGKRGKTCQALRVMGHFGSYAQAEQANNYTHELFHVLSQLPNFVDMFTPFTTDADFGVVREALQRVVVAARNAGVPEFAVDTHDETIKGIHAPVPVLSAGVAGKWAASADISGVRLRQLDDINEWCEITHHDQKGTRAYELAARVWLRVNACATLRDAAAVLREAGCKLHGYCGMD